MPSLTINRAASRPVAIRRNSLLTHLECLRCGAACALTLEHAGCPACASAGVHVSLRAAYRKRARHYCYLPYEDTLGLMPGNTPLLQSPPLAQALNVAGLHIKDESQNPTGSHKDRMSALGAYQALDFGAHTLVLASSGNAAVSAAHYAHAAGLGCEVATYQDMPVSYLAQLAACGATRLVFSDNAGRWRHVARRAAEPGYFALTNHHVPALGSAPLAIEGYKAIAYECHSSGCVPAHIMVPTARGDLAWGIFAGFRDLLEAGEIGALPKIWIVEPFARLSRVLAGEGLHLSYPGHTAQFSTAGATVTYLQWQAAMATGGGAVVVTDDAARRARELLGFHGISAELCAAAGLAGAQQLRLDKKISADEDVLLILTANASRDPSAIQPD